MYDVEMVADMERYDFLVIVGLLIYIAFTVHYLMKDIAAIRKKIDQK
jgi:hypothetical protein